MRAGVAACTFLVLCIAAGTAAQSRTAAERELEVFDRGDRPDYEVISAVISYFEVYPEVYHHPQEDLVFAKLRSRDPAPAAKVGDLAGAHHKGTERLRRVAHAIDSVLADREILRQNVDNIGCDFHRARAASHHDGRS